MLELRFPNDVHKSVKLGPGKLAVGRDPQNDIVLDLDGVSGFHAEIVQDQGVFYLVDLDSTNGTLLDGSRITGRVELRPWQRICFDEVEAEIVDPSGRRPTAVRKAVGTSSAAPAGTAAPQPQGQLVLHFTGGEFGDYPLDKPKTSLGRDPGNDVVIDREGVSGFHAQITEDQGIHYVVDLGSVNGTQLDGAPVTGKMAIRAWQVLTLDEVAIELVDPSGRRPTVARKAVGAGVGEQRGRRGTKVMPADQEILTILKGPDEGKKITLTGDRMSVGRTDENDIVLADDTVSSKHASLIKEDGGWTLVDEGSTNGTFVDRQRTSRRALKDGMEIRFGEVDVSFSAQTVGRSGTVVVDSQDGGGVKATVKREAPGADAFDDLPSERPTETASARRSSAALIYSAAGFVVALSLLLLWIFLKPQGADLPLQAGGLWGVNVPAATSTAVLADINADGMLDVIFGDANGTLHALDGEKGKRIFKKELSDSIIAPPVAGDLNDDGRPDIVVGNNTGQIVAFTEFDGDGRVLWRSSPELMMGAVTNRPTLIDLNGDKTLDIVAPTEKRGLLALDGKSGWTLWETSSLFAQGTVLSAPLVADLNGDSTPDIVGVDHLGNVVALTSQDAKVWSLWTAAVGAVQLTSASPALLKRETEQLVVVAADAGLYAFDAATGDSRWHAADMQGPFGASPLAVDATGDMQEDVVVMGTDGTLYVRDGRKGGEHLTRQIGVSQSATPALQDFNQDGIKDLVLVDRAGALRVVDLNRGRDLLAAGAVAVGTSGTFNGAKLVADAFSASPLLADVNGDGNLDAVCLAENGGVFAMGFNRRTRESHAVWPAYLGAGYSVR